MYEYQVTKRFHYIRVKQCSMQRLKLIFTRRISILNERMGLKHDTQLVHRQTDKQTRQRLSNLEGKNKAVNK